MAAKKKKVQLRRIHTIQKDIERITTLRETDDKVAALKAEAADLKRRIVEASASYDAQLAPLNAELQRAITHAIETEDYQGMRPVRVFSFEWLGATWTAKLPRFGSMGYKAVESELMDAAEDALDIDCVQIEMDTIGLK